MPPRKYTDEHIQYIADNIAGRHPEEMAALFNEHFGTDIPASKIKSLAYRNGLKNGRDCRILVASVGEKYRFKPGFTPWNKGKKKCYVGGEATQFKKGQKGWNYKPVGTERVNSDGYVDVKIADPGKWRQKHILIWEAANRPVPKGHCLIFSDSNPLNVTLDNLLLITRAELAMMNKNGLMSDDADLTNTGVAIADIYLKIGEHKRKNGIR